MIAKIFVVLAVAVCAAMAAPCGMGCGGCGLTIPPTVAPCLGAPGVIAPTFGTGLINSNLHCGFGASHGLGFGGSGYGYGLGFGGLGCGYGFGGGFHHGGFGGCCC